MQKYFSEGSNAGQKLLIQTIRFFASLLLLNTLFPVPVHATVPEQEETKLITGTNNNGDPPSAEYKLIWSDEFNNIELDTTKWSYRKLGPRRDAINVKNTVRLDGHGHLVLSTRRVGEEIHTAMIGTEGKLETTFGYFECRVKMQPSHGHWSAFWLQSSTMQDGGDPKEVGTEIDIYECFEPQDSIVVHNIHWDGYGKDHKQEGSGERIIAGLLEEYHTFGLEWTPLEYVFYVDGKESWRTDKAVSHRDEYIILSLEVGKKQKPILLKEDNFSDSVYFDYVRVYKKSQ